MPRRRQNQQVAQTTPRDRGNGLSLVSNPKPLAILSFIPEALSKIPDSLPPIPVAPNAKFPRDPTSYATDLKVKDGAPLSSQMSSLPEDLLTGDTDIGLMDAPARAALNMPNQKTSHAQAQAFRDMNGTFTDMSSNSVRSFADTHPENTHTPQVISSIPEFSFRRPSGPAFSEGSVGDSDEGHSEKLTLGHLARDAISGSSALNLHNGWASSRNPSRSPSPSMGADSALLRRITIDRSQSPSSQLTRPSFPPPSLSTYSPASPRPLTPFENVKLFLTQTVSVLVSTVFLSGVVIWALGVDTYSKLPTWFKKAPPKEKFPWDNDSYWTKNEKVSKEPRDYARAIGMDIEDQTVETEDGFYLRMHRVVDPKAKKHSNGKGGYPVLILHGLFQSSGSFITSEERSLAFWLAREGGYQVYLGNNRGVFGMGHRTYSKSDPRFWDWTIRELAMYDLPALVSHVLRETGYSKLAFIGHSQGNGLAFISLSKTMCPDLGKRMSCFVALAPAVYAGPLTEGFPFNQIGKIEWPTWKRLFGVLDFIPLMRWVADSNIVPPRVFASLGYIMFAFLFNWTDANWLHRRKIKMFRFTPTPVSSASIFWWCGKGGFADRKCTMDDSLDRWYDERFPPLSIYYGGKDYLVLTEPLLERLEEKEKIKPIRTEMLDVSEHCDFYWAAEAVEQVFHSLRDTIEQTRLPYPEESSQGTASGSRT